MTPGRLLPLAVLALGLVAGAARGEDAAPAAAPATDAAAAASAEAAGAAPDAADIPVPTDPVARAAFDVLDTYCARCHQDGRLVNRLKPAKNFGFILRLDQLAADPHYVVPGNPDASKIMQMILNQEMPYDVYYEADFTKSAPGEADVVALRDWITQLGAAATASCSARDFITPVDEVTAMATDLESLLPTRVADTRYITLTNLYNACTGEAEMEVFRQATVKLLNSLSHVSSPVRMEPVNPEKTILRFNLKDLGWDPEDWDRVLAAYPYAAAPDSRMFDLVASSTLTPLPYVRGDWFAFTASQPPLYDALLRLAPDFPGLQTQVGADVLGNLSAFVARRAGFQHSGVSRNNRLIERHDIPTGYFWTSYDFAGNRDRQSLLAFPLGPGDGPFDFHPDGGETIFSLPNGFQGYYLSTADGTRLDKGPTKIVLDPSRRDQTVTNGISCMGCHDQGIRKAKDEVRDHILGSLTFPKPVRDAVAALYPTAAEMDAILEADGAKFRAAMVAAGLDPALKSNGVEMINALAKRYEDDVELALAAADFGETADVFTSALSASGDADAVRLGRRLDQGLVPRDTFEATFMTIVARVSDLQPIDLSPIIAAVGKTPVAPVSRPRPPRGAFAPPLVSARPAAGVGATPVFTVTAESGCYLTLVNVDGKGTATVLYPNGFQKDNFLPAGRELAFPAPDAPFQFRFADPGVETVAATCGTKNRPVDAVALDPAATFTDLGDYTTHLTRAIKVEAAAGVPAGGKQAAPDDIVARAAIQMTVAP